MRCEWVLILVLFGCERDRFVYKPAKPILGKDVTCGAIADVQRDGLARWVDSEQRELGIVGGFELVKGDETVAATQALCWTKLSDQRYRIDQLLVINPELKL